MVRKEKKDDRSSIGSANIPIFLAGRRKDLEKQIKQQDGGGWKYVLIPVLLAAGTIAFITFKGREEEITRKPAITASAGGRGFAYREPDKQSKYFYNMRSRSFSDLGFRWRDTGLQVKRGCLIRFNGSVKDIEYRVGEGGGDNIDEEFLLYRGEEGKLYLRREAFGKQGSVSVKVYSNEPSGG